MARVFGAVLGKNSGKIGQVNFWVVKGTQFNRAMPVVRKDIRPTSEQLDVREKFATLGKLASAFQAVSKIGLKGMMDKAYENAISVFVQKNQDAVSVMGGAAEVDYGSLKCAAGPMPGVAFGNATFTEALKVAVTYTATSDEPGTDAQDQVYIAVYQPDTNQLMLSAPALRNAGSVEVRVPSTWTGLTVHVYGFAVGGGNDNKDDLTNSSYIGTGTIA